MSEDWYDEEEENNWSDMEEQNIVSDDDDDDDDYEKKEKPNQQIKEEKPNKQCQQNVEKTIKLLRYEENDCIAIPSHDSELFISYVQKFSDDSFTYYADLGKSIFNGDGKWFSCLQKKEKNQEKPSEHIYRHWIYSLIALYGNLDMLISVNEYWRFFPIFQHVFDPSGMIITNYMDSTRLCKWNFIKFATFANQLLMIQFAAQKMEKTQFIQYMLSGKKTAVHIAISFGLLEILNFFLERLRDHFLLDYKKKYQWMIDFVISEQAYSCVPLFCRYFETQMYSTLLRNNDLLTRKLLRETSFIRERYQFTFLFGSKSPKSKIKTAFFDSPIFDKRLIAMIWDCTDWQTKRNQ